MNDITIALIILFLSLGNCACVVVGALAYRLGRVETKPETIKETVAPTVIPPLAEQENREMRRKQAEAAKEVQELEQAFADYDRMWSE